MDAIPDVLHLILPEFDTKFPVCKSPELVQPVALSGPFPELVVPRRDFVDPLLTQGPLYLVKEKINVQSQLRHQVAYFLADRSGQRLHSFDCRTSARLAGQQKPAPKRIVAIAQ